MGGAARWSFSTLLSYPDGLRKDVRKTVYKRYNRSVEEAELFKLVDPGTQQKHWRLREHVRPRGTGCESARAERDTPA